MQRHGVQASDAVSVAPQHSNRLRSGVRRFAANNWKVVLYTLLIVLCVVFAPEAPLKFIYTEF